MDLSDGHRVGPPFKDVPWKAQLLASMCLHAALFWFMTIGWQNNDHVVAPLRQVIDVELITLTRPTEKPPSKPIVEVKELKDVPKSPRFKPKPVITRIPVERPSAEPKPTPVVIADTVKKTQAAKLEQSAPEVIGGKVVEEIETNASAGRVDITDTARALMAATRDYQRRIKKLIENEQRYPLTARKGRQQGRVTVTFQLNKLGNLVASNVTSSSGHRLLDRAAVKAVHAVGQFPALPAELSEETRFQVILHFTLK